MRPLDYRSSLTGVELLHELGELFRMQRRTERLICRYLADLADWMSDPTTQLTSSFLTGHDDVYALARAEFGLSVRATRERIRVGRALRELPATEQALVCGNVSYSRVREVTRVAARDDEHAWLEAARTLSVRALEQRVAAANLAHPTSAGHARDARPVGDEALAGHVELANPAATPSSALAPCASLGRHGAQDAADGIVSDASELVERRMALPSDVWALLERAMEGARHAHGASMDDAQALAAVVRDALAHQARVTAATPQSMADAAIQAGPHGNVRSIAPRTRCENAMTHSGSRSGTPSVAVGATTHSGSPADTSSVAASATTHSGSPAGKQPGGATAPPQRGPCGSNDAAQLLDLMGCNDEWRADSLCEASGFSASKVATLLTLLEIDGRIRRDEVGLIARVA